MTGLLGLMSISFWGVFWIDECNESSFTDGFPAVARICGHQDDCFEDAMSLLENTSQSWLLIFDNVNDMNIGFSRSFSKGEKGGILITTRSSNFKVVMLQTVGNSRLKRLNSGPAIELLLKACGIKLTSRSSYEHDAREVVEFFDCRPFAVVDVGANIRSSHFSLREY